jgi:hypothetical protein
MDDIGVQIVISDAIRVGRDLVAVAVGSKISQPEEAGTIQEPLLEVPANNAGCKPPQPT